MKDIFSNNIKLNEAIYELIKKMCYNSYTNNLWDVTSINNINREKEATSFVEVYLSKNKIKDLEKFSSKEKLIEYVAKQIDKQIPRFFFMELNKTLSYRYNTLLTNRIYMTYGKDGFDITSDLVYRYEHDFEKEKQYIEKTKATEKQIDYLKQIADEQCFQMSNEEFLTKINAKTFISYFKGEIDEEPLLFSFFFVPF